MPDREKVIKGLEICFEHGFWNDLDCKCNEAYKDCPYHGCETGCIATIAKDTLAILKEQEVRELTMDEWQEWKNNTKRNPICKLWEHDTSPMWILNPNDVHEPAFLIGKLKLFTGQPTFEQCKAVKWE
jgi:hypothetical protein